MRFIGKIATLPVRRHLEDWDDRAQTVKVVQKGIIAVFEQGTLSAHEVEAGYAHLGPFRGLPTYEDEVTTVAPRKLLRVYDTDAWAISEHWDAATKTQVESFLLEHELYGREFIAVETPRTPAPWPAYDKLAGKTPAQLRKLAETVAAKVLEDEYDPALVLAYEQENLNRTEIVIALQALLPAADAEPDPMADPDLVEA